MSNFVKIRCFFSDLERERCQKIAVSPEIAKNWQKMECKSRMERDDLPKLTGNEAPGSTTGRIF